MNKAVLISIQPKWCELIASGKKTVEVRKTEPEIDVPFKVYIYCTKDKNHSFCTDDGNQYTHIGNGKVIGEFVCDNINTIEYASGTIIEQGRCEGIYTLEGSCITSFDYVVDYMGKQHKAYGWHISNLVIYDKPKELLEFYKCGAKSLQELDEDVCAYCIETDYGINKGYCTPRGYVSCEGRWCNEAYQNYLDAEFAIVRPPQSWCYVKELKEY